MRNRKTSSTNLKISLILTIAGLLSIPLSANSQTNYHNILTEKRAKIAHQKAEIDQINQTSTSQYANLARSCYNAGYYDDALVYYNKCVKFNIYFNKSLFACANIYLKRGEIALAKECVKKITDQEIANLGRAKIAISLCDFGRAETLLKAILKDKPGNSEALFQLALVKIARNKVNNAIEILHSIKLDKSIAPSVNYLLADIMLKHKRNLPEAERLVSLALKSDPLHSQSHRLLGMINFRKKDMENCEKHLRLALEIDPWNFPARSALGNGRTSKSYSRDLLSPDLLKIRKEFNNYSDTDNHQPALEKLSSLSQKDNSPQVLTDMATIYYYMGDLKNSEKLANMALAKCDYWGLSHFIISLCQQQRIRSQDTITSPVRITILAGKHETPANLDDIFINFETLNPEHQTLVLSSINPLRKHLARIKEAGGTFYFLPVNHFLWEAEKSIVRAGQKTFDGRLWDDVKGVGGKNSVTGTAELEETLEGGFNVFAHEFAHQIHYMALDQQQKQRIKELYNKALEEGSTLDYYAAANDMEYFAQGYEAFVSPVKRPLLKSTACHTRQELLEKDPALFAFIASLTE